MLKDRWRQRLFYTCVAAGDGIDVEVRSAGLDRAFWTEDDVVAQGSRGAATTARTLLRSFGGY